VRANAAGGRRVTHEFTLRVDRTDRSLLA